MLTELPRRFKWHLRNWKHNFNVPFKNVPEQKWLRYPVFFQLIIFFLNCWFSTKGRERNWQIFSLFKLDKDIFHNPQYLSDKGLYGTVWNRTWRSLRDKSPEIQWQPLQLICLVWKTVLFWVNYIKLDVEISRPPGYLLNHPL